MFLNISQIYPKNTYAEVPFLIKSQVLQNTLQQGCFDFSKIPCFTYASLVNEECLDDRGGPDGSLSLSDLYK